MAESIPTHLEGPLLFAPRVLGDGRGFFAETFRAEQLAEQGVAADFVQDNHSRSDRGVLRGIHFQVGRGQAKLVRCARGSILDVIVDVRPTSPAFGDWESFVLDDESMHVLWVPVGFGHGFCVTSEVADVVYKCTSYYDPELERGIAWNDPEVGIAWPELDVQISDRDAAAPRLAEIRDQLSFE